MGPGPWRATLKDTHLLTGKGPGENAPLVTQLDQAILRSGWSNDQYYRTSSLQSSAIMVYIQGRSEMKDRTHAP
jgi:hypothetical protein